MTKTLHPPRSRVSAVVEFFDRLAPSTRYALFGLLAAAAVTLLVLGGLVLTSEPSGPGQRILVPR